MSANLPRRLNRELQDIARDAEASGVLAWPLGDDIRQMRGRFLGPPDTPYAGGTYVVSISATNEYPFKPPSFSFETKIWHPNVSSVTGTICLDSLGSGWTPVQTIKSILISLRVLLEKPNPSDPQDAEVAKTMLSDPESFARQAHEWAVVYAGAPRNPAGTWPGYENSSSDMTPRPRRPEE
jgi:ubiquitin-conjugating enzyme (huntingtin interacting protein 2)